MNREEIIQELANKMFLDAWFEEKEEARMAAEIAYDFISDKIDSENQRLKELLKLLDVPGNVIETFSTKEITEEDKKWALSVIKEHKNSL